MSAAHASGAVQQSVQPGRPVASTPERTSEGRADVRAAAASAGACARSQDGTHPAGSAVAGAPAFCDSLAVRRPRRHAAQNFSAESASKRRANSAPALSKASSHSHSSVCATGAQQCLSVRAKPGVPQHKQVSAAAQAGDATSSDGLNALRALGGSAPLLDDSDSPCMQSSEALEGMPKRRRVLSVRSTAPSSSDAASFADALGKRGSSASVGRQAPGAKRACTSQPGAQQRTQARNSSKSSAASAPAGGAESGSPASSTSAAKLPRGLEVQDFGRIEYLTPTFHRTDAVFPVGFKVRGFLSLDSTNHPCDPHAAHTITLVLLTATFLCCMHNRNVDTSLPEHVVA